MTLAITPLLRRFSLEVLLEESIVRPLEERVAVIQPNVEEDTVARTHARICMAHAVAVEHVAACAARLHG